MKHQGDLTITAANREKFADLTEVTGSLYIHADASLPALTTVGGYLDISVGKMTTPMLTAAHGEKGELLAVSEYGLWRSAEGYYYAGCRGPLSKERALAHWNRTDERAVVFTTAIKTAS